MSTYAERVKQARGHAKLSQADLAARLGGKASQQTIGYLENDKNSPRGSQYTAGIAQACGVDAVWLATGRGEMHADTGPRVSEPPGRYDLKNKEAADLAHTWSELSPAAQEWTRNLIWMLRLSEKRYPWFWRGKPRAGSYDAWETQIERNYEYAVIAAAKKPKAKS